MKQKWFKKVSATFMAGIMTVSVLAGCGSSSEPVKSSENEANVETTSEAEPSGGEEGAEAAALDISEPVTLKWYLHGNNVTDDTAVMEKVNEYLGEKLNVTLEPIWGTWGDFNEGATLAINGGDDIDIYFTSAWTDDEYNQYAKKGAWVRLDDPENNLIEQYGQDIWNLLPGVLKEGAEVEGSDGYGIYAVPVYKDFATQNTWDINVTMLEELGYTLEDIENRTFYEFGEILQKAKEVKGEDFYPLNCGGMVLERMVTNSIIVNGDSGACNVLSYYIDPTDVSTDLGSKIVNKYATEEYKKFVEKVREYYLAGYIDPAMANSSTSSDALSGAQKSANYLIGTQSYALGYEIQASHDRGIHVEYVPCTPPYVDKTSAQGAMMAISTASKNPERAMAFLNLVNTDPYLLTLLEYGIEGVHYTLNENGLVEFTEERSNYIPWRNGMANVTILPPQKEEGQGFFTDTFIPYYESAKAIPAFGYVFDPTNVETELAALANIAGQYAQALNIGVMDPETALPEFLQKLNDAGMQKVVDEANAQLEAYFESIQ